MSPSPGSNPFPWSVLLWPALWVACWIADRFDRALFEDWEPEYADTNRRRADDE